jgi:hypothetical protein
MTELHKREHDRAHSPDELASASLDEPPPRVAVPPGTELLVEVEGVYGHLKSELVGYRLEQYLVIRTPAGPPGLSSKLFRGNTLVIRYLEEGRAIGFQSTIIHSNVEPEPLLFLLAPKLMQERSLRMARRLDTYLVCKAVVQNQLVDGTLIDISRHGYRCVLPTHLAHGVLRPQAGDRVALTTELGGSPVQLSGTVRNVALFPASVRLGVAFEHHDKATEERIVQFLIKEGVEA